MHKTFRNPDKPEEYNVYSSPDCEFVNPSYYFAQLYRNQLLEMDLSIFRIKNIKPTPLIIEKLKDSALDLWQKKFKAAVNYKLQDEIKQLYVWANKKSQIKLAAKINFNTESLFAFMIQAGDSYKYKYSRYVSDYHPKELENKQFPAFIYRESKDRFITQGDTDLSFGELKVSIEKRRRVIAEFLDDRENWHCVFRTLLSISGNEEPHLNQPHLHYLSSNWGIKREDVVEQLKSYRYKLPSIFIPFVKHEVDESVYTASNSKNPYPNSDTII